MKTKRPAAGKVAIDRIEVAGTAALNATTVPPQSAAKCGEVPPVAAAGEVPEGPGEVEGGMEPDVALALQMVDTETARLLRAEAARRGVPLLTVVKEAILAHKGAGEGAGEPLPAKKGPPRRKGKIRPLTEGEKVAICGEDRGRPFWTWNNQGVGFLGMGLGWLEYVLKQPPAARAKMIGDMDTVESALCGMAYQVLCQALEAPALPAGGSAVMVVLRKPMLAELQAIEEAILVSVPDLCRHFICAGLDAFRRGDGVSALARWGGGESAPPAALPTVSEPVAA